MLPEQYESDRASLTETLAKLNTRLDAIEAQAVELEANRKVIVDAFRDDVLNAVREIAVATVQAFATKVGAQITT